MPRPRLPDWGGQPIVPAGEEDRLSGPRHVRNHCCALVGEEVDEELLDAVGRVAHQVQQPEGDRAFRRILDGRCAAMHLGQPRVRISLR